MASPVRTLTVNFVGKTKDLDKAFKRVSKGSSLMSDRMARAASIGMGAFAGIGAAVVGATAVLKPMIEGAADVEESLSKNRVLFGDAAAAAERFAEGSAEAIGMSRREALEAVGVFGSLAHAMGMPQAEGVDLSVTMTKLAADMASFGNVSVEETLTALQAGLRGEAEPLRRFGVLLDAATLKAKALQMGLIENEKKALTPQAKALAAYEVILEQTLIQQDDFIRTSDGLANQQKILASTFDNISVEIGEKLLPAFTSIVTFLNEEFIPAFEDALDDPSVYNIAKGFGSVLHAGVAAGYVEGEVDAPLMITIMEILTLGPEDITGLIGMGWDIFTGVKSGWDGAAESNRLNFVDPDVMAEFGQNLEGMFAEIAANFGVDISDVVNREGRRNEPPPGGGPADAEIAAMIDQAAAEIGVILDIHDPAAADAAARAEMQAALDAVAADAAAAAAADAAARAEMQVALEAAAAALTAAAADAAARLEMQAGLDKAAADAAALAEAAAAVDAAAADRGFTPADAVKVDEMADISAWLAGGGAQAGMFGAAPAVNVTINAPAVTGKEVIDAMAEAVKQNGPFSRQWVGQ